MLKIKLILIVIIFSTIISGAQSQIVEIESTTQGFLPPRMTTAQRGAIASPSNGLMIFNTSTGRLNYYDAGWLELYPEPHADNNIIVDYFLSLPNGLQFLLDSGVTIQSLLNTGASIQSLLDTGVSLQSLLDAGASLQSLFDIGETLQSLFDAGVTIQSLLTAGETPLNIMNTIPSISTSSFIGLNYQGGIIFYMLTDGTGLVAAPTDQSPGAEWGCLGTDITGAEGLLIGTGKSNTTAIVAQPLTCAPPFDRAADICDDLMLNGFDDWFLPSRDELNEMYLNIGQPNNLVGLNGAYWSSTQTVVGDIAFLFNFFGGSSPAAFKDTNLGVRAIREF